MGKEIKKIKILVLLNLLFLLVYAGYNEWQKLQPAQIQAICQLVGFDEEKGLFGVNCLKK